MTEAPDLLPALPPEMLDQIEVLLAEERTERPGIWKACEDYAANTVRQEAAGGSLDDFRKLGERRESLTRKYAIEQLVNYGLQEGMAQDDFTLLFYNVMGPEGYAEFTASRLPERDVIDDLRARVYVLTQFGKAEPDSGLTSGEEKETMLFVPKGTL